MGLDYLPTWKVKNGHEQGEINGLVNIPYMEHLGLNIFITFEHHVGLILSVSLEGFQKALDRGHWDNTTAGTTATNNTSTIVWSLLQFDQGLLSGFTLPETNIAPENRPSQ